MAQGHEQHGGAETDAFGAGGDGGEGCQGFQAGLGSEAVADPYGVQPGILDGPGHAQDQLSVGGGFIPEQQAAGGQEYSKLGKDFRHWRSWLGTVKAWNPGGA